MEKCFFNEDAFTELEKKTVSGAEPEAAEDQQILRDIMISLHTYVDTVTRGEIDVRLISHRTEGQEYRDLISDYDQKRHLAHEAAISDTKLLNRLAAVYHVPPVFTGDESQRHEVADFCLEFDRFIFVNRRKKLS